MAPADDPETIMVHLWPRVNQPGTCNESRIDTLAMLNMATRMPTRIIIGKEELLQNLGISLTRRKKTGTESSGENEENPDRASSRLSALLLVRAPAWPVEVGD